MSASSDIANDLYILTGQVAQVAASVEEQWTVESARDLVTRIGALEEELNRIKLRAWLLKTEALKARAREES